MGQSYRGGTVPALPINGYRVTIKSLPKPGKQRPSYGCEVFLGPCGETTRLGLRG
jgi:hypothetical protein